MLIGYRMRSSLPTPVRDTTSGIFTSLADSILFIASLPLVLSSGDRSTRGIYESFAGARSLNVASIRRAIRHARTSGWIKDDLTVTRRGAERLQSMLPRPYAYPKKWDGTWNLVSFDIPERDRSKRAWLRSALVRLGFAALHQSLWLSPLAHLGDVLEWGRSRQLRNHLIVFRSKEVGTSFSGNLANRLWHLDDLNDRYERFLLRTTRDDLPRFTLLTEYLSIVAKDPFLPKPLLPDDWLGERARTAYEKLHRRA